ncbi:MAG: helix-turn-helix transcriptional regulator [Candidatus Paceibacterota bacterium]|jgi:transcriptional regulator with XRE-family HTH domain
MSTIGKNIKRYRLDKGLSQDKLSKLADLSLNTIVKIELDESPNPTIETIQRIAKALDVSVDDLLKK